jgi:hypothetical protein
VDPIKAISEQGGLLEQGAGESRVFCARTSVERFPSDGHQKLHIEDVTRTMTDNAMKHPFLFLLAMLLLTTLSCLPPAAAFASTPLSSEQERTANELVKGYGSGASGFWNVFGDMKERIDGPVLKKVLDHAAAKQDSALVALVLEGARVKGDEKTLASLMLSAADVLLSIGRHDDALRLYDSAMPLARNLEDPVLMAKAHEGNGDVTFYSGNPTNALLMYGRTRRSQCQGGSLPARCRCTQDGGVLIQTGDTDRRHMFWTEPFAS